ncbi:MAG: helix-turn-helix transcriptional regulator [Clostridia bacterium]|nr:helix-turn-helix transcriptional regulator [Clostridia bacterium]
MNRIKLLREEKQMYQEDLGNILGISKSAVGFYENEKRDIPTEILKKLSDIFNVSVDYILGNSDIRNSKQENDINDALIQVGFDMKDYNPPTEKQKEQIKALIEVVLKDNKKDKKD